MSFYVLVDINQHDNVVFVMQLCLLVIATQVCTCHMNNQLLQKENIPGKDRRSDQEGFID